LPVDLESGRDLAWCWTCAGVYWAFNSLIRGESGNENRFQTNPYFRNDDDCRPGLSNSIAMFLTCEQEDDATKADLNALASKWVKTAKTMKGGENIEVYLQFPVVAKTNAADFAVVITSPSLTEWGTFMDGYEGSDLEDLDTEWDDLASCPDSALFKSVHVK